MHFSVIRVNLHPRFFSQKLVWMSLKLQCKISFSLHKGIFKFKMLSLKTCLDVPHILYKKAFSGNLPKCTLLKCTVYSTVGKYLTG